MTAETLKQIVRLTPNWSYSHTSLGRSHWLIVYVWVFKKLEGAADAGMLKFEGKAENEDEAAADVWAQINKNIWRHQ